MLLDYADFITGALSFAIAYAFFKSNEDDEIYDDEHVEFTGRYVTLSCQTCRKLKKHKEIEANLYQCTKCKRHVDLR